MPANMGFPMPPPPAAPEKDDIWAKLTSMLGGPQGVLNLGASLMAAGGPSPQRTSLGQALGGGLLANQQFQAQQGDQQLRQLLLASQIQKAKQTQQKPLNVGAGGAVIDPTTGKVLFQNPANKTEDTSSIRDYEYYQKLTPEQQKQFISLQRQPTVPQLSIVNGVPTLVNKLDGTLNPLSTLGSEADAARRLKEAEAAGSAFGKVSGELAGSIAKKASDAKGVQSLFDDVDGLIDVATGSVAGATRDKVAKVFGYAPTGAQAIAELQVLQANLMLQQPRMEGPQSDRDTMLYREAAGQIGDPTVPGPLKKAAWRRIVEIQQRYIDRASQAGIAPAAAATPTPQSPARRRFNPATGKIE